MRHSLKRNWFFRWQHFMRHSPRVVVERVAEIAAGHISKQMKNGIVVLGFAAYTHAKLINL